MARPWDADVVIGPVLAARLVERQFPALAPVRLQALGAGWDNEAYLVNDALVFRFPRRALAAELLPHEVRWLPALAPALPLAVPVPRYKGAPDDGYPYTFAGYAWLPGRTACSLPSDTRARLAAAHPLGRFVAALRTLPLAPDAPPDALARADVARRAPPLLARLEATAPLAPELPWERVRACLRELAGVAPFTGPRCWSHGDLYPRHVLVDPAGGACGVIDWGDLHAGDPALDLSLAFTFCPPGEARDAFRASCGEVSADTWTRARFRGFHYGVALLQYGLEVGDGALERAGRDSLRWTLED